MGKLSLGAAVAAFPWVLSVLPSLPSALPEDDADEAEEAAMMLLIDSSHSLVSPRKKCVRVFMAMAESTISALIAAT